MLRKLKLFKSAYYSGDSYFSVQEDTRMLENLKDEVVDFFQLHNRSSTLESIYTGNGVADGRSAFSFVCSNGDRKKTFLKANVPGVDNKAVLFKEYRILSELYGVNEFKFHDISDDKAVIEMKLLNRLDESLKPEIVQKLMKCAQNKIKEIAFSNEEMYDISDVLRSSYGEMEFLTSIGLMNDSDVSICGELLDFVKSEIDGMTRCLCHGDYGDANIMVGNGELYIIDWEDALWGSTNYDYLYWLTFFSHRKYYSKEILGASSHERRLNIAMMTMIIIVKEAMNVYNGEFKNNRLTAHDRINEIITFL